MCTAVTFKTKDHYFGRNLDLDFSYNETVTITPRNFPLKFRHTKSILKHYAIIGIAYVCESYPLYYDAVNEKGLCVAGLSFPYNAYYLSPSKEKENIAPFEFIPLILSRCSDINEAKRLLSEIDIVNTHFSNELQNTPLHWIISDSNTSITVEPRKGGLEMFDNPVGVLANNPTFEVQMQNLTNYMKLSPKQPENSFAQSINLKCFSSGMGSIGLPGDLSSQSRFVRAAFNTLNSVSDTSEFSNVNRLFHILDSVAQIKGCNVSDKDTLEYTVYSSCCNASKGIYYYSAYENRSITEYDMHKENLDSDKLTAYQLIRTKHLRHTTTAGIEG